MKKIAIILLLMMACIATSCVEPYKESNTLVFDNNEVSLPYSVKDGDIHYLHITSNGSWTAKLETADGNSWCWIQDYFEVYNGGNAEKVQVVTPLSSFEGMEEMGRWNKVQGSGSVYMPLRFVQNANKWRYAVLIVTNIDTGEERILRIRQNYK